MNDYINYTVVDFANDGQFLNWVKHPGRDPELDHFWEKWTAEHVEKRDDLDEAKRVILAVVEEQQFVATEEKQLEIWARLQHSIKNKQSKKKELYLLAAYKVAASIVLMVTLTGAIWWFAGGKSTDSPPFDSIGSGVVKEFNNSNLPKTIVLGDGSSIVLKPKSSLEFPKVFDTSFREVWLTGEAFFEVAKDAKWPFLVHADDLITKVLGTSFIIRAFENEQNVLVQVKTGKVSVFMESDAQANKNKGNAQLEGVLLIPNQQVVFVRQDSRMVKSLVENPILLNPALNQSFVFKDTPLKKVFVSIETAYGVDIVFDEEVMANCLLNASLEDMPLYDKMRLICKGINAQYEILDSHIIVSGKGCN